MNTEFDQEFVRCYYPLVEYTRRRLPPGLGDAEDFVQQAYLRCRNGWSPCRASSYSAMSYFQQSIHWSLIDAVRRRCRDDDRRRQYARTSPASSSPAATITLVAEALFSLSPRLRLLGQLLMAGKSTSEIALELNISKTAYTVSHCRLRRALSSWMRAG